MRLVIILWCALFCLAAACSQDKPADQTTSPPAPAAKVISRSEPARPYPEAITVRLVVHDKGYTPSGLPIFSDPSGRELTLEERDQFEAALKHVTIVQHPPPSPDGEVAMAAACFIPHHFFRYFDRRGRQIGEVAVCFCCEGAQTEPSLPFQTGPDSYLDSDIEKIRALVTTMGLPTDVGCDDF